MKITIEIDEEDAKLIKTLLATTKDVEVNASSHGPLNMKKLARMLLKDVALAVRRPGSWEGANMRQVLASHGYEM